MSSLSIDIVAPPFHGHLHPILGVARVLKEFGAVRVLSTPDAAAVVAAAGLDFHPLLQQRAGDVWRVANTVRRVRGRPWMLVTQLRQNLDLVADLRAEVEDAWRSRLPDLAVVDFTLPTIGHWAQAAGIHWWTSHPSPLAIETADGTPSYLGGWSPPAGWPGRARDALGRRVVRWGKQAVFTLLRRRMNRVGWTSLYRADGTERVYSDEVILALGWRELEFDRTWPAALRFVGPVLFTPPTATTAPALDPQRQNVLVTLGTHLPYLRARMPAQIAAWASAVPEVCWHYTTGGFPEPEVSTGPNWRIYRYLDYPREVAKFDAVIHHAGAGITYHTLYQALPAVVWPQDNDQFDIAARLEHRGLALRCHRPGQIPAALRRVLAEPDWRVRSQAFVRACSALDLRGHLLDLLRNQAWRGA